MRYQTRKSLTYGSDQAVDVMAFLPESRTFESRQLTPPLVTAYNWQAPLFLKNDVHCCCQSKLIKMVK